MYIGIKSVIYSLFLILCWSVLAPAQENPILLDYNEALKMALVDDPGLAAMEDKIRGADFRVSQSVSAFNPKLNAFSAYSRSSLESKFELVDPITGSPRIIDMFSEDRYKFGFSISHNIYNFGGRSASKKAAMLGVDLARIEREEYKRSIFDRVTRAYLKAIFLKENLLIHKKNIKRAGKKLEIVNSRIAEGLASEYDKIKAELLVLGYKNDLAMADGEYQKSRLSLKALLGKQVSEEIVPIGDLASFVIELPDPDDSAVENNLAYQALGKSIDISWERIEFQKSLYYPRLAYSTAYEWQNGFQPDIDKIEGYWIVGLSINLNLLDGGERRSRIGIARYESRSAGHNRSDLISYINADVEAAQTEISTAESEMNLARERLDLARRGLKIAEARYDEGLLSISDLLDLELEEAAARIGLNHSLLKIALARVNLKTAAGHYPEFDRRESLKR